MKIAIGSDKSGFSLKEELKKALIDQGHTVEDYGLTDPNGVRPYYEVAPVVARKIQAHEADRGILVCGTGAGMAIVANKFKGVYAVTVEGSYTARMSRIINQANVITMGGWVVAPQQATDMVTRWLAASFTEGFPEDRQKFLCGAFDQVGQIEAANFKD
jgi:ribose 5-phosphate isomerase B